MNLYLLAAIFLTSTCSVILIILLLCRKTKIQKVWVLFNFALLIWGIGNILVGLSHDVESALLAWKIAHLGGLFIAVFFYHTIFLFSNSQKKVFLIFVYAQAFLFQIFNFFTDLFVSKTQIYYNLFYMQSEGFIYPFAFIIWLAITVIGHIELIQYHNKVGGIKKLQARYLLFGFLIGFLGGSSTLLPVHGIKIIPFGNFTMPIYTIIATYAILKYQLLDIRVAISRLTIFAIVYALVLGIPFYIYFALNRPFMALVIMGILATAGPFMYLFLQRRAEEHLLQEDLRIQNFLVQASYEMTGIHTFEILNKFVVDLVVNSLNLDRAEIFVLDKFESCYKTLSNGEETAKIKEDDLIVACIRGRLLPILYEEVKLKVESEKTKKLTVLLEMMHARFYYMIVPIHMNSMLAGFIGLGKRTNNESYSKGMLNALSVLSNQTALALENCRYIKEENERMEEEGALERMISLDHMASSMAHEIDNPQSAILAQADFIIEVLEGDLRVSIPEEIWKDVKDGLLSIQEYSARVSAMIKVILDYSRKGTGELKPIKLYPSIESFEKLIHPELAKHRLVIDKEIESDLPCILGDKILVEEILLNFGRNAIHAVQYIKIEKKLKLKVFKKDDKTIRIEFIDNGYGIEKKLLQDVFLASVTTKGSVEGTGLGLYRVRKVVEKMNGKVWAESEGKGKGATLIAELPILREKFDDIVEDNDHDDRLPDSKMVF